MKGYDLLMFMRAYMVSYQGKGIYFLRDDEMIINTTQIVSIKLDRESPKLETSEQQEKIEKIFDTKLDDLAIFKIDFSDKTYAYVIGPKNKFDSIK